jgi:LPXTG-motif cell wall-anchored protein
MGGFDVRRLRVAIVAGAIAGSTLVSTAVVATDDVPPVDETVVSTAEYPPTTDPPTDEPPVEDIVVIEMVIVEGEVPDSLAPSSEAAEAADPEAVGSDTTGSVPPATVVATLEHADGESEHEDGHGGSGHQGGSGGEGNPYVMSFEVVWLDPDGNSLAVRSGEWRSSFGLSAGSATGRGMPTSATCTYPDDGSDDLRCVFVNPGHRSGADGLVIPARPTATYTVTVSWEPTDWTIAGANEGPYSARDLCPRGGHEGGDGGHDSDGGHEAGDGGQRRAFACVHTVVMQQTAVVETPTDPPGVEPVEPVEPVVNDRPAATDTAAAASPVAAAVVTAGTLPATGNSVTVVLLLAGLLVAVGSTVVRISRATSSSGEVEA